MKKILLFMIIIPVLFLMSCGSSYTVIDGDQAKQMLDDDSSIVLVDVRTAVEFNAEHIPGAILLPVDIIDSYAEEIIPDKSVTYIIYCNSGNRSAQASAILVDLGYKNIYDMGGIQDWNYETE